MVNFELVKVIKKDVFHLIASVGQRKILRPHQDSIPHRDSEFFFCPMLTTRQKTSFFILCPKFVFIVFILLSSLFYGGNSLHVPKMVGKKAYSKSCDRIWCLCMRSFHFVLSIKLLVAF